MTMHDGAALPSVAPLLSPNSIRDHPPPVPRCLWLSSSSPQPSPSHSPSLLPARAATSSAPKPSNTSLAMHLYHSPNLPLPQDFPSTQLFKEGLPSHTSPYLWYWIVVANDKDAHIFNVFFAPILYWTGIYCPYIILYLAGISLTVS